MLLRVTDPSPWQLLSMCATPCPTSSHARALSLSFSRARSLARFLSRITHYHPCRAADQANVFVSLMMLPVMQLQTLEKVQ